MSKYYAVKVGRCTGIFNDWTTCQAHVTGFSGAVFKSFKSLDEAQAFLGTSYGAQNTIPTIPKNITPTITQNNIPTVPQNTVPIVPQNNIPIVPQNNIPIVAQNNIPIVAQNNIPTILQNTVQEFSQIVYTDGSCINKKGGWAYVLIKDNNVYQKYAYVPYVDCTNNIAELYAIWKCLTDIQGNIYIYSDSEYSINCVTKHIYKWLRNGWKTSKGDPVENKDLIESIFGLMQGRKIKFEHVYSHTGNPYNELADKLANQGREQILKVKAN